MDNTNKDELNRLADFFSALESTAENIYGNRRFFNGQLEEIQMAFWKMPPEYCADDQLVKRVAETLCHQLAARMGLIPFGLIPRSEHDRPTGAFSGASATHH